MVLAKPDTLPEGKAGDSKPLDPPHKVQKSTRELLEAALNGLHASVFDEPDSSIKVSLATHPQDFPRAIGQLQTLQGLHYSLSIPEGLRVEDSHLEAISKLPGVDGLAVHLSEKVTPAGLAHLKGLKGNLKSLEISVFHLPPALKQQSDFAFLSELVELRKLDLTRLPLAGAPQKFLPRQPHLQVLTLADCQLSDADIAPLMKLVDLKELSVWRNPSLSATGLSVLANLTRLEKLTLFDTKADDKIARLFSKMPRLKSLMLNATAITDAGVEALEGATELEELDLCNTQITGSGFRKFTRHTRLKKLDLAFGCKKLSGVGLSGLVNCKGLTSLNFTNSAINNNGLADIAKLVALKNLDLPEFLNGADYEVLPIPAEQINEAGLKHLGTMQGLESLSVFGLGVTDAALAHLQTIQNLTSLKIGGPNVKGSCLERLKNLPKLTKLDLKDTQITDDSLKSLAGFKSLENISFPRGTTDAAVPHIKQLPHIKTIMGLGKISDKGKAEIKGSLKDAFIF